MKKFLIAALCCFLAGCAAGIPKKSYAPTDPNTIKVVKDLPVNAELLQRVTATACSSNPIGSAPSTAVVLADLKKQAAQIGATGIYKVRYSATGLLQKCVTLPGRMATGLAIRADPQKSVYE